MKEESVGFDYDAVDRSISALFPDAEEIRHTAQREAMRGMRHVFDSALANIFNSPNPRFVALQWLIVIDSPTLRGVSITEMAKPFCRTKQALSKGCRDVCEKAKLPPSQYMRSLDAVESYRDRQNEKVRKAA